MTEKSIYQKGKFKVEEWEDVNYCQHCFYNDEEPLWENNEVVDLLNNQNTRIKELQTELNDEKHLNKLHINELKTMINQLEKQHTEYQEAVDEEYLTIQSTAQTLLTHLNYTITNKKQFKEKFNYTEYKRIQEFLTALSILDLTGLEKAIKELKQ